MPPSLLPRPPSPLPPLFFLPAVFRWQVLPARTGGSEAAESLCLWMLFYTTVVCCVLAGRAWNRDAWGGRVSYQALRGVPVRFEILSVGQRVLSGPLDAMQPLVRTSTGFALQ